MIKTTIKKWGNSLAVRIPQSLVDKLNLHDGNEVVLDLTDKGILLHAEEDVKISDWQKFLIPMKNNKKENVSGNVDKILYGR